MTRKEILFHRRSSNAPTSQQWEVLFFIRDYCHTHRGRSPSLQEIQTQFNWKSNRTVTYHIERLIQKGLLFKQRGYRGLTPTTLQEQKVVLQNLLLQDA